MSAEQGRRTDLITAQLNNRFYRTARQVHDSIRIKLESRTGEKIWDEAVTGRILMKLAETGRAATQVEPVLTRTRAGKWTHRWTRVYRGGWS